MNLASPFFNLLRLFSAVSFPTGLRGPLLPPFENGGSAICEGKVLRLLERHSRRGLILRIFLLCFIATPILALAVTPMLAAGFGHTIVLKSDGTVMTWGNNAYGQLGDGTTIARSSPVAMSGLTGVVAVAAGGFYNVALKADGTVLAWGYNEDGELGDGTMIGRLSPVAVPGLSGVVAVAAGQYHTLALKSDGKVVSWGRNGFGQLGDGTIIGRLSPVAVPGLTGVAVVAAGGNHNVALKTDGTTVAWGRNITGQLGDGTAIQHSSPVTISGFSGVVAVAAGGEHTVALKANGTVVASGYNIYGQLGDGTSIQRSSPVAAVGLTDVIAVAAGQYHTVALKSDGTLVTWGRNDLGQLGDGTKIGRMSPIALSDPTGVVAVAAGQYHTLALKSDGTVLAWGVNSDGQLGDGTTMSHSSPVTVPGSLNAGMTLPTTSLSTTSLAFAERNVGSSSAPQTLTLTNTGGDPLYFFSIIGSGDYARTTTCGITLLAGANCDISVTFSPTATRARNGVLSIVSHGVILNSANLIGIGLGPIVSLGSTSLSFAVQNLDTSSAGEIVTLSNTGNAALSIASIAASSDYAVAHNCGTGLGTGGFCMLDITFTPTASGNRTGVVTITNDAFDSPQIISLIGTGQGGTVSLNTTSISLAGQSIGTTSAAQPIILTNLGGAVLNIASIAANGDFAQTTTCGATLSQAASCTISVTFSPTVSGTRSGSVVITSDAASSPNTITLSGIGVGVPLVALNPTTLSFAGQNVGTSSTAQTVSLTNSGSAALNLASITASGDFSVTNNCGAGLGTAGSCSLSVVFTPTVAGTRTGAITITSNAVGSPHSVSLSGTDNGPPSAPTGISAIPGDTQGTITFGPPSSDGGSPITGYNVSCNAGAVNVSAQISPVSLTGLTNGTLYSCFVTATNSLGVSPPSPSIDVTPSATSPIFLVAVQSRKTHTGVGPFDLRIDTTQTGNGLVTVEPRGIGAGHTIAFQFNVVIDSFGAVSATDFLSGISTSVPATRFGKEVIVTLAGIPDNRPIVITLNGVTGPVDSTNATASIGFLVGDINNTRSVNASDISGVKARSGQTTTGANFKFDVDASGTVNSSDLSAVKARSGLTLP